MSRHFIDHELHIGQNLILPAAVSHHVRKVLRLGPGKELILFNGLDCYDYRARIVRIQKKSVEVKIKDRRKGACPQSKLRIELILSISKREKMDWAIQKAVEMGVDVIVPLLADRTVVKLDMDKKLKRGQHWQKIIISACEQSGRVYIPELLPIMSLQDTFNLYRHAHHLILNPQADKKLTAIEPQSQSICLWVGAEGGWSEAEKKFFEYYQQQESVHLDQVRLGSYVLRTETAPLAAIAAVQTLWGDFRA